MRHKIHKWFWVWDFDKEEKWLNEMAAKGMSLVSVGWCTYWFEDTDAGAYQYRLELLEKSPEHPESRKYISFVEETGAEYLGSVINWVYFRRPTNSGEFELHSDHATRIKHLNRILRLLLVLMLCNLYPAIYNGWLYFGVSHFTLNLVCACISLAVELLVAAGLLIVLRKRRKLEREGKLFE
ncbi:MAG: DUF2812 domain-containing protein [Clostridia bacterium]|nr:DUF2812 domain-containing protein [Clostridia bacterium]